MRSACLTLLFIGYVLNIVTWPLYEQYTLFSNWTMHITTMSIVMTVTAVRSQTFKNDTWFIFANHMFYSFSIPLNLMVVILYWNLIHHKTIGKHRADGPWYKPVCQYWIHIVPAVCCITNSAITNIVLSRKPIWIQMFLGFAYCMFNYVMTRILGEPIYGFMPWDTFMGTFKIVCGLIILYAIIYLTICKIDESFKVKLVQRRDAMGLVAA